MSILRVIFPWAVAACGLAVILLTYVQAAIEGVYFDDHGLPDNLSSTPELILGSIGLLLLIGGAVAGVLSIRIARRGAGH